MPLRYDIRRQPGKTIEFGGPEALSPSEAVARFEKISGAPFRVEHVSELALLAQFEGATNPLQKSFAALMHGDAMNMAPVVDAFGIELGSVDDYARSVLGKAGSV